MLDLVDKKSVRQQVQASPYRNPSDDILASSASFCLVVVCLTLASTLGADDHAAVLKAIVDWFALLASERLVYTYQSSFGKTAAEASAAPNLDVNYTRCLKADERWGDGDELSL